MRPPSTSIAGARKTGDEEVREPRSKLTKRRTFIENVEFYSLRVHSQGSSEYSQPNGLFGGEFPTPCRVP